VIIATRDFTGSQSGHRDLAGHGTHVAGVIGAKANGVGVVGICPDLAQDSGGLVIGKVLADDGAGLDEWVTAGIDWAVDQGAAVISMSLGSSSPSSQMHAAIKRALNQGVFVICAAGNNGDDNSVDYPAKYRETIAVAAVDRHGRVAAFSSRGLEVDIAAPGEDVLSTFPQGRYAKLSGTSTSAPFVTGVVALMLSKHRQQGSDTPITNTIELREHLARTATDAGPRGHDPAYGFGLINPKTMLAPEGIAPPPWLGLRWDVTVGGHEAAFVLVPRDATVSLEIPLGQSEELTNNAGSDGR
jgi:subtilisin family serine protease